MIPPKYLRLYAGKVLTVEDNPAQTYFFIDKHNRQPNTKQSYIANTAMRVRFLLITLLMISGYNIAGAIPTRLDNKAASDSLYSELSKATNPADSLSILYNLFDVLPRDTGVPVGFEMIDVADRASNPEAALDVIRNLANRFIRKDSMLQVLYDRTLRYNNPDIEHYIPVSQDDLKETQTFLSLLRNTSQARQNDLDERREALMKLQKTMSLTPPEDLYERIVLQHAICTLLAHFGASDLLTTKLDELGRMVAELPTQSIALRNFYNVTSARLYSENGDYERAMQADQNTLDCITTLEAKYAKQKRNFRNYDANRYVIYTRFLSNYPLLAPHEVEKYYKMAMRLVDSDFTSYETNRIFPGPQIYYNLSNKNYATALQYIKSCIDDPHNQHLHRRLIKDEIECAQALGDNETLLQASLEYNTILEKHLSERLDQKLQELQLLSDTSDITDSYNRLTLEKQQSEAKALRKFTILMAVAAAILLIFVIVLYNLNRRNKQLVKTLDQSNHALRTESENLENSRAELLKARDSAQKANNLKTDFIKNMSYEVSAPLKAINEYCKLIVDCANASDRKYLERFTSLVELNSDLLTTIVNDVLHISEIDSNSVPIKNRSTDLRNLCSMVLDGVRNRLAPGVSLQFDASSPAISLFTDPQRLHQILLNLLTNAAKFTTKGSIMLGYTIDPSNEKVIFNVTDTGIGIKADKKEVIFDRFVKLDKETQGAGLGLTISRMLARLLGGDLHLDTSYNKGARFVLAIPKK